MTWTRVGTWPCRDAGVDQALAIALAVPGGDIRGADFEFERCGDAVRGFVALVLEVLAVGVEVDEAGRHHQGRLRRACACP